MILKLLIGLSILLSSQSPNYQQALELYSQGMYQRARVLFETCGDVALSEDYLLLCAIRLESPDLKALVEEADRYRGKSILNSEIHRQYALLLFEQGLYEQALDELKKVDTSSLSSQQAGEYWYKKGYCLFNLQEYSAARSDLAKSVEYHTGYLYPAYFSLGVIDYVSRDFTRAQSCFELSVCDPRFKDLSEFYLVDCHFMTGDHDYVLSRGEAIFEQMSPERQKHLARMLSEAYLVKGDATNARKYLDRGETMSNSDYFRAGCVQYAVGDYYSAISNFERMSNKTDSLAQIAAYQKAYSYIQIKNKVKAMDSFREASTLSFDPMIKEDALFNYAKLSFDLNNDESIFRQYIKTYGTTRKGELIYDYLAMSALLKKDYARAVEAYDNIDELSEDQISNYVKANFLRSQQLLSIGSYTAAVPYLKAAAYYLPKDDEFGQLCRYSLANTYYIIDDYKDALTVYNDLYNLSALYGRDEGELIPYNIAYCFFKQRDYQNAARWFDIYISSSDALARQDALTRRADCDFSQKNYKAAAKSYMNSVREFPSMDNLYPYYFMGVAQGLAGNKKGKVEALSVALKADSKVPYYSQSLYELGRAYADVSDSESALKAFDKLYASSEDVEYKAKALIGKGMVKRNQGDMEGALKDYKSLVKQFPDSPYISDALLSIQSIYTSMKQAEKYIEYLEANKLSVGKTEAEKQSLYFSTAEQVFLASNYQQAINYFSKYLGMYPDSKQSAEAYYYIAASYKNLGQKEKACDYYKKSMDKGLSGSFAEFALMDFAILSDALEDFESAYEAYISLASDKYPMSSKEDAFLGAMRSAYKAHFYEKAISAASNFLKLTKSSDLRREAQYIQAKSYLSTSQREKAFQLLTKLISEPNTAEGAESYYLIIQARFDWGQFEKVEEGVFDFSAKCSDQPYWLAKAFITLADSYIERGMNEQAIATYQSVLDGYVPYGPEDDILETVNHKLTEIKVEN